MQDDDSEKKRQEELSNWMERQIQRETETPEKMMRKKPFWSRKRIALFVIASAVAIAVAVLVPIAGIIVGSLILLIANIWEFHMIFFGESSEVQRYYMFVPFYSVYYMFTRWDKAKYPLFIGIVGAAVLIPGWWMYASQEEPYEYTGLEAAFDEFMVAGSAGDVDGAYASMALGSDKSELAAFIDNNRDLFEEYEALRRYLHSVGSTDGDLAGGIIYTGGRTLQYGAMFVKENETWKIKAFSINCTFAGEFGEYFEKSKSSPCSTFNRPYEYTDLEAVLDKFMVAGKAEDVDRAYAIMASPSDKSELDTFIKNNRRNLFRDYEALRKDTYDVSTTEGHLTGALIYLNDTRFRFGASFVKENETWKITAFSLGCTLAGDSDFAVEQSDRLFCCGNLEEKIYEVGEQAATPKQAE